MEDVAGGRKVGRADKPKVEGDEKVPRYRPIEEAFLTTTGRTCDLVRERIDRARAKGKIKFAASAGLEKKKGMAGTRGVTTPKRS